MKAQRKKIWIGSVAWLFACIGGLIMAQDQAPAISPELTKAGEAMVLAMDQKEIEKAFAVMTDKGADQYSGMMLLQASQISQMGGGAAQMGEFQELQKAVAKYGLDKIDLEMPMPDSSSKPEKIVEEMLGALNAAEKKVLACVPANERRKVVAEMLATMRKFMVSPMSLKLGDFEVNDAEAEAPVLASVPAEFEASQEEAAEMPIEFLLFIQKDGHWRFDGFNRRRMLENAMKDEAFASLTQPFKEIEGLTIEGKTVEDQSVSLASYQGKVVLVDFWGTWCGPCVASLPKMTELHAKYQSRGFEILGVAADEVDSLKPFLSNKPLPWKNIVDGDTSLAAKYSINAFPTTLLVDKQGKHVATNLQGASLEKAIELLLDGQSLLSLTGSAQEILDAGKQRAAKENKLVFLHFSATWCGPCQMLEKWLSRPDVHELLGNVFVDVKIDTDANAGAQELLTEFSPDASGIPWYAMLNSTDSQPIATCEEEKTGNIGFPDSAEGIDHFLKMFKATGKFSQDQLDLIRASIKEVVESH